MRIRGYAYIIFQLLKLFLPANGSRHRSHSVAEWGTDGWRGADSLTKRIEPKVMKNAILAVTIQPSACTHA